MCKCRGTILLLLSCFLSGTLATTPQMVYTCNVGENVTLFCVGTISGMSSKDIITSKDIMMLHTSIYWNTSTKMLNVTDTTQYDGGVNDNPSLTIISTTCSDAGYYMCSCVDNAFVGLSVLLVTVDCSEDDTYIHWPAILASVAAVLTVILMFIQICINYTVNRTMSTEPSTCWCGGCYCVICKPFLKLQRKPSRFVCRCIEQIPCNCIPVVKISKPIYDNGTITLKIQQSDPNTTITWKVLENKRLTQIFEDEDNENYSFEKDSLKIQKSVDKTAYYICRETGSFCIATKSKIEVKPFIDPNSGNGGGGGNSGNDGDLNIGNGGGGGNGGRNAYGGGGGYGGGCGYGRGGGYGGGDGYGGVGGYGGGGEYRGRGGYGRCGRNGENSGDWNSGNEGGNGYGGEGGNGRNGKVEMEETIGKTDQTGDAGNGEMVTMVVK